MRFIIQTILVTLLIAPGVVMAGSAAEERIVKPKSKSDTERVAALKGIIRTSNHLLSAASAKLLLFAKLADKEKSEKAGYLIASNKVVKVASPKSWPDETVTGYIVLVRDNGTVQAFQEVPTSESGDWDNSYIHYYDDAGNTIAFERYSFFFNGCEEFESAKETSTYYFQRHALIAKDYVLVGNEGKTSKHLRPSQCDFLYRFEYAIRKTWAESKAAARIPFPTVK